MPYAERMNGSARPEKKRLKVIIVGGSVAGLTLAHCLDASNIDFVVLEAYKEIAPQVGASIVVLPSGARVLDQLGIFEDVTVKMEPLNTAQTWTGDGRLVCANDAPHLMKSRMGYDLAFLQRRDLLQVLYDHVKDKSKVLLEKRVVGIDQDEKGATVHCSDGSTYKGDIVVGTDGVHSAVRRLLQEHIEESKPGATKKDVDGMSAEYNCIFGISNPVEGHVIPGDTHRSYAQDHSTLAFIGRGNMLFWFLFSKLDKVCYGKDIPRYTTKDAEEAAKAFYDIHMTDEIKFKDVWEQRTFVNMTSLQESQNQHWTSDRIVCAGDSIHKMTPNMGAGGNAAIESAAALANSISKLNSDPTLQDVQNCLRGYYEKRHLRANIICTSANELTRLEAFRRISDKLMALYAVPALGDFLSDLTCDVMVGGELLDYLPVPPKSLHATMPWNPESGVGKKESKLMRALWALPLLGVTYTAQKTMGAIVEHLLPLLQASSAVGKVELAAGLTVPLHKVFFGIKSIDGFIAAFVAFFTPILGDFDPLSAAQGMTFIGDIIPLQTIWLVEGIRRGNFVTAAHLLPTVLGLLYQMKGLGLIAPIWFFLHYVQSPLENYHAADNRLTQMGPVKTIIPTIITSFIIPTIAMTRAPQLETRQWINGLLWQPFPLYAAIYQRIFGLFVKDTTQVDRVSKPEADMPYLRRAYAFAAITAALPNLYVRFTAPVSLKDLFFSGLRNPSTPGTFMEGAAKFLKYDQLLTFGAGAIWTMLHFKDLKKSGKLQSGWLKILGIFGATTLVAGPGAAMVTMWAWREEILAARNKVDKN